MRWDALFADLQAQLDAADAAALDAEIAERVRIETGALSLADRLRGHRATTPDAPLAVTLPAGTVVRGTVLDVGSDLVLLAEEARGHVLIPLQWVVMMTGLGRPARTEPSAVLRRLGLRHALRGLGRQREPVRLLTTNGQLTGMIDRVGADHIDVSDRRGGELSPPSGWFAVPLASIVAVWPG